MIDERSQKTISTLLPSIQQIFTDFMIDAQIRAKELGFSYIAINGTRNWDEQLALYNQGRSTSGKIVTNAKPGSSYHNFGLAIDCGVFQDGKYLDISSPKDANAVHKQMSPIAKKHNLRWGGDFKSIKDMPHFEYNTPYTLAELRLMRGEGKQIIV